MAKIMTEDNKSIPPLDIDEIQLDEGTIQEQDAELKAKEKLQPRLAPEKPQPQPQNQEKQQYKNKKKPKPKPKPESELEEDKKTLLDKILELLELYILNLKQLAVMPKEDTKKDEIQEELKGFGVDPNEEPDVQEELRSKPNPAPKPRPDTPEPEQDLEVEYCEEENDSLGRLGDKIGQLSKNIAKATADVSQIPLEHDGPTGSMVSGAGNHELAPQPPKPRPEDMPMLDSQPGQPSSGPDSENKKAAFTSPVRPKPPKPTPFGDDNDPYQGNFNG